MEAYKNQKFNGRSFVLDEAVFINCTLTDCDIFYRGGDFSYLNTPFVNCRFHFLGAAKNTLALAQSIGMMQPAQTQPQSLTGPGMKTN